MSPDPASAAAASVVERVRAVADPVRAAGAARFFRTGPGQYGAGDVFLGVTVPQVTAIAKEHTGLPVAVLEILLDDPVHEVRLTALKVMARECALARTPGERRAELLELYLRRTDRVNSWDLVDASAPDVLGRAVLGGSHDVLHRLVRSPSMWERRIAIVATLTLVRAGELDETFALAEQLLGDPEDLLHKATGWLLREAGKVDEARLRAFLYAHAATMPRTALRYAIERLDAGSRAHYLGLRAAGAARPAGTALPVEPAHAARREA
jgi:3-methyladenine DNA glycosylase AlkD